LRLGAAGVSRRKHHLHSSNPVGKLVNLKINSHMEFPQKLAQLRKELALTQEEMGERLGVSGNWISLLELGKKEPAAATLNHVELIAEAVEAGLVHAPGRPKRAGLGNAIPENPDPAGRATILREDAVPYGGRRTRMIPVVGWAHAGQATAYDEIPAHSAELVPTECRDEKAFAVKLEGDSMDGDGALSFAAGDLLVAMPSEIPYSGCFVVAKFANDGVTFRRLETAGARITLVPLNKRYEVTTHAAEEFQWMYPVHGRWTQLWKR
jgi:SOS-response transcriptional repressor LexA